MPRKKEDTEGLSLGRVLRLPEDETFSIGQIYEEEAATTLCCKKCGGRKFYVGQGRYFTAIMCPDCKWETCIHDG